MNQEKHCTCPICNQSFTPGVGITVDEHLARGILKVYAEMQKKNKHDNSLPCPRCGKNSMSANILQNALSRHYNIHICDACGNREATEAAVGKNHPIESWWAVSEILKRK